MQTLATIAALTTLIGTTDGGPGCGAQDFSNTGSCMPGATGGATGAGGSLLLHPVKRATRVTTTSACRALIHRSLRTVPPSLHCPTSPCAAPVVCASTPNALICALRRRDVAVPEGEPIDGYFSCVRQGCRCIMCAQNGRMTLVLASLDGSVIAALGLTAVDTWDVHQPGRASRSNRTQGYPRSTISLAHRPGRRHSLFGQGRARPLLGQEPANRSYEQTTGRQPRCHRQRVEPSRSPCRPKHGRSAPSKRRHPALRGNCQERTAPDDRSDESGPSATNAPSTGTSP